MLISSRIGRCIICALILGFLYPKGLKTPTTQLQTTKPAKFSAIATYAKIKLRLYLYYITKPFISNTI